MLPNAPVAVLPIAREVSWHNVDDLQQLDEAKQPRQRVQNVHQRYRSRISPRNLQLVAFCTSRATRRPHFFSGVVGQGESAEEEFRNAWASLGETLTAAGVGYEDIIDTTIYMVELQNARAMSKAKTNLSKNLTQPPRGSVSPNWSFQGQELRSKFWRENRDKDRYRPSFFTLTSATLPLLTGNRAKAGHLRGAEAFRSGKSIRPSFRKKHHLPREMACSGEPLTLQRPA